MGSWSFSFPKESVITKDEVRDILGLAERPDDAFMEALEAAGEEETVAGVPPVEEEGYTAEEIRCEVRQAVSSELNEG